MYYFVERSVAVVKPKTPFLNWINSSFDDSSVQLTLESLRVDCNSYLIPEVDEIEDGINFIDEKFANIFALELSAWSEDQSTWPQQEFTLKMFWEWFDVEISPATIDITEVEESDVSIPSTVH